MKTFIAALIIFALLCTLVFLTSHFIKAQTGALLELACALPATTEDFQNAKNLKNETAELCELWAQSMKFFPYIMSYDMLDRADDAALALSAAAESNCEEDFISARLHFIDTVARLSGLFALSFESIA